MTPLPCPFCGGEPDLPKRLYDPVSRRYAIYCPTCEFYGPVGKSSALAIEAWNYRYYQSSPYQAEIDAIKKELAELRERKR